MDNNKSLDPYRQIFIAALRDVQTSHATVFSPRALRLTIQKVDNRCTREGLGFLTKTLPRLGKALDRALSGEVPLDCGSIRFEPYANTKLPKFLGELFRCVFAHDGWILPTPCVDCIKSLRDLLFMFYKLEVPYDTDQEQKVLDQFEKTDSELGSWNDTFRKLRECIEADADTSGFNPDIVSIVKVARISLARLFSHFDPHDIHPSHGPGAVSTGERLSGKYVWTSISERLIAEYPLDAYFYASLGHICDDQDRMNKIEVRESSARVLLVPKDSRGPRLISCEPLTFQWIQQGLSRAIVQEVERNPLTRHSVHFTNQQTNQLGALLGSSTGKYATLDLKEASDRVCLELVRLLFPKHVYTCLEAARSLSTRLPDGRILTLQKYAPMGSALCFPVMALTIWSILHAGFLDANVRLKNPTKGLYYKFLRLIGPNDDIYVYGDDVIVPTAKAANAIRILESFGLLVNRDKSYVSGFFRESCGIDAYKGVNVTPVRIRTVWTPAQHPSSFTSYLAYARAMWNRGFKHCYDKIVEYITKLYRNIPEDGTTSSLLSLPYVPEEARPKRWRINPFLQKKEWLVTDVRTPKTYETLPGWNMLLRFFAEACTTERVSLRLPELTGPSQMHGARLANGMLNPNHAFSVRQYTKRGASYLAQRWR